MDEPTSSRLGEGALNMNGRLAPVHLLCFVEMHGLKAGGLRVHNEIIDSDGIYAVCHAVTQLPPTRVNHASLLFKWAIKDIRADNILDDYTDRNMLMYMIPADRIRKPCVLSLIHI